MHDEPVSVNKEKREPRIEMTVRGEGTSMKELHKKMERAMRHKGRRTKRSSRR